MSDSEFLPQEGPKAFVSVWRKVILDPRGFYRDMPATGGFKPLDFFGHLWTFLFYPQGYCRRSSRCRQCPLLGCLGFYLRPWHPDAGVPVCFPRRRGLRREPAYKILRRGLSGSRLGARSWGLRLSVQFLSCFPWHGENS